MFSCVFCCPIEITEAEAPNGRIYNSLLFAGTVDLAHDLEASQHLGAMFGGAEYTRCSLLLDQIWRIYTNFLKATRYDLMFACLEVSFKGESCITMLILKYLNCVAGWIRC